jgi:hypothetical protein
MIKILFLGLFLFVVMGATAQTPGLIIKPAGSGSNPLDPNGDGYTSVDATGFQTDDVAESELPFNSLVRPDPSGDPTRGPSGAFNDIVGVDATGKDAILTYTDGVNLFFRFRIGGFAPNSKTYAVFVDTDQKFGFTGPNSDPNAVVGNPGFELEISLHTNFTVSVYNIDGSTSPSLIASFPYDTHCQKSISLTNNGGDPDYFYDFYVPMSALNGVTMNTPLRFVTLTTMNPNSAINSNAQSDVGGTAAGTNLDNVFTDLIDNQTPTVPGGEVLDRSACPSIVAPILANATSVSGFTAEGAGTIIRIYLNGIFANSVTTSGTNWTVVGLSPLASGIVVTATAQASGKGESFSSCNSVFVGGDCASPIVAPSVNGKGVCGDIGAAVPGALIKLYDSNMQLITANPVNPVAFSDGSFVWSCNGNTNNCNSGGNCLPNGRYYITQTPSGQCESQGVWVCLGTSGTTPTPSITTPVLTSNSAVTGTGVAGARVYLFNATGAMLGSALVNSSGAWSIIPNSPLTNCMGIYANQLGASNLCVSANTAITYVLGNVQAVAPVIYGANCIPSASLPLTQVSGFSIEAAGAVVRIYNASTNAQIGGTALVNSMGEWTLTGISLPAGTSIYARVTDTANCRIQSSPSPTVTITTQTALGSLVITTNPITENLTTSVSGTGGTAGAIVTLYLDEYDVLGTATVAAGGSWTVNGINASILTAGSLVKATQKVGSNCESPFSAGVQVQCQLPSTSFSLSPVVPGYCEQEFGQITINPSQVGVIYTPVLASNNSTFGYSAIGTGGSLNLTTYGLVTDPTVFKVRATKISGISCSTVGASTVSLDMYPNPTRTLAVTPSAATLCGGGNLNISISNSQSDVLYQLQSLSTGQNLGNAQTGNGGTLVLNTGPLYTSQQISVLATRSYGSINCEVFLNNTTTVSITGPTTNQSVTVSPNFLCAPASVTISVATVNDGLTYRVYRSSDNSLIGSFTGNGSIRTITTATLNATQTFYVLVTSGGCTDVRLQNEATVYFSTLTVSNAVVTPVSCNGGNNGSIAITTTGGVNAPTYQWSNSKTTAANSGLVSGNYTLTLRDGLQCPQEFTYFVPQPDLLELHPTVLQNEVNGGDGMVSFAYLGGTPNYNLEWTRTIPASPSVFGAVSNLTQLESPYLASNLPQGTYSVTLTDQRGCTTVGSFVVSEPSCVLVNGLVTNVSCYGLSDGSIDLLVDNENVSYLWNTGATTQDISGLIAGAYSVTVTCNSNNESHTFNFTVHQPASPLSVTGYTVSDVLCYGDTNGAISITSVSGGTPGYNFTWSGPIGWAGSNLQSISGLTPGTYTLIVTDTKDCYYQASYNVSHLQPEPLGLTLSPTHVTSYGGSNGAIVATATGGVTPYSYSWSNNTILNNPINNNLLAGTYQLVVTDANGCTISQTINLTQPVDALSNCSYRIGSDFESGGFAGNWSTGSLGWVAGWSPAGVANRIAVGNVTSPNNSSALRLGMLNGSNDNYSVTISRSANLSVFSGTAIFSLDYSVQSFYSGDVAYLDVIFKSGTNSVTNTTTFIFNPSNLQGSVSYSIPSAYLMSNFEVELTFRNPTAANQKNTASINIDNVRITSTKEFEVTATPTNLSCFESANGSIGTTVNSSKPGISTYTYAWSNGGTGSSIASLNAGSYTLSVTDRGGCVVSLPAVTVTQPAKLSATVNKINPSCPGTSTGSINILSPVNGNGSGYQFRVTRGATVISDWSVSTSYAALPAGTYQVSMRNLNAPNCETLVNDNIVLLDADVTPPVVVCPASIVRTTNTNSCQANVNVPGPVTMTDNCGTPTLTWTSSGAKTGSGAGVVGTALNPFPVGTTTINYIVTDGAGNTSSCSFTVTVNTNLSPDGLSVNVFNICQGNNALAYVSGALTDGIYIISYTLGGANVGTHTTNMTVSLGSGGGSFPITSDKLANAGVTTISFNSIESQGTNCSTSLSGVSGSFTVNSTPGAPTGNASQEFCSYEDPSVNDLVVVGTQVKWYDQASGGSQLAGSTSLVHNATYYASQSTGGCESNSRLAVTALVYAPPTIVGTSAGSRCGTGTVGLSATSSSGLVRWYDSPLGGTMLFEGNNYTTASLSVSTSYWVTATDNGCENPTRTEVVATIYTIPTITSVSDSERCGTGALILGASASSGDVNWYALNAGGAVLYTGTNFTTPSISTSTTYYVAAISNGCVSAVRTPVVATIKPIPTVVSVSGDSRCGSGQVTLTATPSSGVINWYDSSAGGTLLQAASNNYSPTITATTIFYAEAVSNGCVSSARTAVTAVVIAYPTGTLTSNDADNSICEGQSVTFSTNGGDNYDFRVNGASVQNSGASTFTTTSLDNNDVVSVFVSSSGCTSTDYNTLTITVLPNPSITLGTNPSICAGGTSAELPFTATSGTPTQYTIDWDQAALNAGFVSNTFAFPGSSPITLTVPGGASPNTYSGTVVVYNAAGCFSASYPFSVTLTNCSGSCTIGEDDCRANMQAVLDAAGNLRTYDPSDPGFNSNDFNNLNLASTDVLYIKSGSFSGSFNGGAVGSLIVIGPNGNFNFTNLNNFNGTVLNYNTTQTQTFGFTANIENYGGTIQLGNQQAKNILNCSGTILRSGDLNLPTGYSIFNKGTFTITGQQQGAGCIQNEGDMEMGSYSASCLLFNNWRLVVNGQFQANGGEIHNEGWMTMNSFIGLCNITNNGKMEIDGTGASLVLNGGTVINNCTLFSTLSGTNFENNTSIQNNGLIYFPEGNWKNRAVFTNGSTGVIRAKTLLNTDNGVVTGTGRFYVTDNATNNNNSTFGLPGDAINFYNVAGPGNGFNINTHIIGTSVYYTQFPEPLYSPDLSAYQCGDVVQSVSVVPGVIGTSQTICEETTLSLTNETSASASGTIAPESITYQWQSRTESGIYADIVGATSATYGPVTLNATTYYRRLAYATYSGANSIYNTSGFSNEVVITRSTGTPTVISTQPLAQSICVPNNATFSVVANVADSYQWQVSTNGGSSWSNVANGGAYSGANTATLLLTNPGTGFNGNRYRVEVLNASCGNVMSDDVLLTVTASCITIVDHPISQEVCDGTSASFTTEVDNVTSPIFVWQIFNTVSSIWENLTVAAPYSVDGTVANTSTLIIANVTGLGGRLYRCEITDGAATVETNGATLTVNPLPDDTYTLTDPIICPGNSATVTLSDSDVGVNYTLRSGTTPVSGVNVELGTGGAISYTVPTLVTTTLNVLATNATTGCSVQLTDFGTITVNNINLAVAYVSTDECPEFLPPFNANTDSYNAGRSGVEYTITRAGTAGDWRFKLSYDVVAIDPVTNNPVALTGAGIVLVQVTQGATNYSADVNGYFNIPDAVNTIEVRMEVANEPGRKLVVTLEATDAESNGCTEIAGDLANNESEITILPMPAIGGFN